MAKTAGEGGGSRKRVGPIDHPTYTPPKLKAVKGPVTRTKTPRTVSKAVSLPLKPKTRAKRPI